MTPTLFALYDKTTGLVTSSGNAPTLEDATANESSSVGVYIGTSNIGQRLVNSVPEDVIPSQETLANNKWELVKLKRASLLSRCDWVVTKAAEAGTTVPPDWSSYRQALRDITLQADPSAIVWPIAP